MTTDNSPRLVRYAQGDDRNQLEKLKSPSIRIMEGPDLATNDSGESGSSGDSQSEMPSASLDSSLHSYYDSSNHTTPFSSFDARASMSSLIPDLRKRSGSGDVNASSARLLELTTNGGTSRPQRPIGPARTPSSTYAPARRPQNPPHSISIAIQRNRSSSASRVRRDPNASYRAQEKAYVQRLRQDQPTEYFEPYTPSIGYSTESDTDEESPTSDIHFDNDPYDQETLLFYGNEDVQPTTEDLKDPANRERLEWHGMLASVLTGDVVRQEKKRLIGASEKQGEYSLKAELWLGIRSKICGRTLAAQRRIVEDGRANLAATLEEITKFEVQGESEAGKSPIQQVRDVVKKIEKCESLYPSQTALVNANKAAGSAQYQATCDAVISWHNTTELINTELAILQSWVGNAELDFLRAKERSPGANGLSDESSFIDRLLKEDGLKSLQGKKSMLLGVSEVIQKAKSTLIQNSEAFAKRHLPPYIEELLTLISFPSRLIEDIIKVRLAYAKKMKDSAQQNSMMQEQMISQFQILLKLAIRIKQEYAAISQPQPGWDLPPCIDESFDQVALDALKYYFKMLSWRLGGNKNAFKEAEVLEQEWNFSNEIGRHLQGGDIEVAEQFSSLTHKALYRLSQTFEKELQRKPKETAAEMNKRYKQILDSVRVRQRMLQRFSRVLRDRFENATDFSIAMSREKLMHLYDCLIETGHFLVYTASFEHDGIFLIASPSLWDRPYYIQSILGTCYHEDDTPEDPTNPYLLILRPEIPVHWGGRAIDANIREPPVDVKIGHIRLIADGSQARLANARLSFLDSIDMHLDMVVEERSNLHKVNTKLTEIKRVAYKLSNTIMDSVEIIRKQTEGKDCQELIQACFVFATEFGQRSLLYMDRNRRQMNNIKLTKLALDWVSFICDDCIAADRKTFRWAVLALEFAMVMTNGSHILSLGEDEYAKLRAKVAGCMSLLISHFDIMGARSTLAAQAEKHRTEALAGQFRKDVGRLLDDEESAEYVQKERLEQLAVLDEVRKQKEAERQALGRVLEESNEADRSLTSLSSSATNVTMRWSQGQFVGGGTFGSVYAAINLDSGYLMAVKEIRLQDPQLIPTIACQIRDEMGVLEVLDHPNIVSYYGIEVHRDKVYIFMEYCSGGSLAGLLEHGRIEDEQVIMVYALQLLEGLAYLHESGIVHRDIKPESE
jgi:mitogen-activated protein kinase kinase kinase